MISVLIILLAVVAAVGFGLWLELKGNVSEKTPLPGLIALEKKEKAERKAKLVAAFRSAPDGRLTNHDIKHLLLVSDSTVTRYLDELEVEGEVRQVGASGRDVYYVRA